MRQAVEARLTTIAVTDHDTTAAVPRAAELCAAAGLTLVPGIEITAIEEGGDVHVLGYFVDPRHAGFQEFLSRQRAIRSERVRAIAERLASLGVPIDIGPLLELAHEQDGRSVGRPLVAQALVAAGHAEDTSDAFDRWLSRGRPGFIPRSGASTEAVIRSIHGAGGLASLAHPVLAGIDARIPSLREAGLDALEAYHSEHDPLTRDRYVAMAHRLDMLVTGGSDYHGDPAHGLAPGTVTLPAQDWERLSEWPRRSSR